MKRAAILLLLLIAEITLFLAISGNSFDSPSTLFRFLRSYFADLIAHSTPTLVAAFGMTIILMTAGIDLSIGSTIALVSCVMASFPAGPAFWWTALPAGLAVGLGAGALNGFLVARLDVPPIIATLGTMIFYRGLCLVVMGDLEKAPFLDVPGYEALGHFGGAAGLSAGVFILGGIISSTRYGAVIS